MFSLNLDLLSNILIGVTALILGLFLFFRAGKYDLVDDDILFDTVIIFAVGALIGGRILDFILRLDFYNLQLSKLVFFNVYSGFNLYGALVGAGVLGAVYLNKKRINPWIIFDFAVLPIIFSSVVYFLGNYIVYKNIIALVNFLLLLIAFWIFKRFEKEKKFAGFFVGLGLVVVSVINLTLFVINAESKSVFNFSSYNLFLPVATLLVGVFLLYFLSKKTFTEDVKNLGAQILLGTLKFKRVLTNMHEANQVAKAIIFLPITLAKFIYDLVKLLGREIYYSFKELLIVFGVKK